MTGNRLDKLKDDFGDELARAGRQPPRRTPLGRRTLAFAAAPAVVAVAVALLVWPGGGSGLDVVAQARAALTPSEDEIVHLVITTSSKTPDGQQGPHTSEQWSATNPTRWRSVSEVVGALVAPSKRLDSDADDHPDRGGVLLDVGPGKRLDSDAERVTVQSQQSYKPGEFRNYLTRSNGLSVLLGPGADERSRVPSALGLGDGDPVSELAGMLSSGQLKDAGTVQSEGRTVRRLVGMSSGVHADGTPRSVVFDVDPQTFAPIAGSTSLKIGDQRRITTRFEVKLYERLPFDDTTAELLRIPTNRDTKVVAERGGADLIERGTCTHQPGSGDVICKRPAR